MSTIPNIVIDQCFGSLGIELTPAQMKITTPRPEMQITNEPPEFTVEQKFPELKVNWDNDYKASAAKPMRRQQHIAAPQVHVQNHNTENHTNSDELGASRARGTRRAKQRSQQKQINMEQVQINLNSVPASSPKYEWTPGVININWTRGNLSVDWVGEYMPQVVVDPPFSIDVYLREKPYIKIMVEDGSAPGPAGANVDMKL